MHVLSDTAINDLITESKTLASDFLARARLRPKRGHEEAEIVVSGNAGSVFHILLRRSRIDPLDFSAILAYAPSGTNRLFRLRRYNGRSHEHTNKLEGERLPLTFHIHYATQRYQAAGFQEDAYARPTDRYTNLEQALECLVNDCAFELPVDPRMLPF
jgi:hypothetical protein